MDPGASLCARPCLPATLCQRCPPLVGAARRGPRQASLRLGSPCLYPTSPVALAPVDAAARGTCCMALRRTSTAVQGLYRHGWPRCAGKAMLAPRRSAHEYTSAPCVASVREQTIHSIGLSGCQAAGAPVYSRTRSGYTLAHLVRKRDPWTVVHPRAPGEVGGIHALDSARRGYDQRFHTVPSAR